MDHGHTRLFHRGGGERREADDVARGVDVGDAGLKVLVDVDEAPLAHPHAQVLEAEPAHVALPAGGEQGDIAGDALAPLQVQLGAVAPHRHPGDAVVEHEAEAEPLQLLLEAQGDLTVHEGEGTAP